MGKNRQPKFAHAPAVGKQAKAATTPEPRKVPKVATMRGGLLTWRFSAADKAGPFSWAALDDASVYKEVMEHLHSFETMSDADINQNGSHAVDVDGICKEAKDRLAEIQMDDLDQLFSFRLSGKRRVWCRMSGSLMTILWWDPEHQVWPSKKKHT